MSNDPKLKIENVKTDTLVPYAGNAKKHPEWQVDQIAASIEEFGNCDPIAVWHNENGDPEIVEGHGRLLALKQLGIETAPVISLDHLTDEQRRAYTQIHNKLNMNTGFDMEALSNDIEALDFDWEEFGFDAFDMAEIATSTNDFEPNTEEIAEYAMTGERGLVSYNVIICCLDQDEQDWLKGVLHEDARLKRLYMAKELKERFDE